MKLFEIKYLIYTSMSYNKFIYLICIKKSLQIINSLYLLNTLIICRLFIACVNWRKIEYSVRNIISSCHLLLCNICRCFLKRCLIVSKWIKLNDMKHDFAEFLDGREIFVTMTVHNHNKRVDSIFWRRQMNMYNLNCYHLNLIFSLFMKW